MLAYAKILTLREEVGYRVSGLVVLFIEEVDDSTFVEADNEHLKSLVKTVKKTYHEDVLV